MPFLNLDTLPELLGASWGWSANRPALAWFRRADFHGDPSLPLKDAVLDTVFHASGVRPTGPVYMLGNLRYFGFIINPICCYYCFSADGNTLEYMVVDVTNTPWKQRHSYVLAAAGDSETLKTNFSKEMHVSPFYPMDMRYEWQSNTPSEKLYISLVNTRADKREFEASLTMRKTEATPASLRRALLAYPYMTIKVGLAIYWQALRLWLKGTKFYSHPESSSETRSETETNRSNENKL